VRQSAIGNVPADAERGLAGHVEAGEGVQGSDSGSLPGLGPEVPQVLPPSDSCLPVGRQTGVPGPPASRRSASGFRSWNPCFVLTSMIVPTQQGLQGQLKGCDAGWCCGSHRLHLRPLGVQVSCFVSCLAS